MGLSVTPARMGAPQGQAPALFPVSNPLLLAGMMQALFMFVGAKPDYEQKGSRKPEVDLHSCHLAPCR